MSAANWNALLPNFTEIEAMSAEDMAAASEAIETQGASIGFGIAAIGNLLACAASNDETGLCKDTATDIGWLLQSLGTLSAKLSDSRNAIADRRRRGGSQ
ncbi:hypothetical protein PH586_03730 [Pseudomonas sp. SA3-5]|uniref:DUF3077 domain-containing protein n=1 Tax=Pseudomonas aestuarii TaxID=3018340 RepID=A0ABT4XBD0_9PSED|nr:hypothetical protein [Pseudomonas aestuarii]MDA7085502.1 hypothetical protein [Pseudomonas aestuarii]